MSDSLSKALYQVSVGLSFVEKNTKGHDWCTVNCCKTAPTATSDASVMIQVRVSSLRWKSNVAVAKACLMSSRALIVG